MPQLVYSQLVIKSFGLCTGDDKKSSDNIDDNLLWAKLLSFREAG